MENSKKCVGILGGGQLAWMLAQAAHELGYNVAGLVKSRDEPLTRLNYVEIFYDETLEKFVEAVDVLCFESEFFDETSLQKILRLRPSLESKPGLSTMRLLRDKLEQKKLFSELSIPQPQYRELRQEFFEADLADIKSEFSKGFVVKRALGGYDGKGNFFVDKPKDSATIEALKGFCSKAFADASRLYAEKRVEFEREVALVAVASSQRGEFMSYPLMITRQVSGACQEVWGPAVPMGVETEFALQASRAAVSITKRCPDLACFALEFFCDKTQGLLLNELAPRVHNSGHFSLLEAQRSQFHNHIRSVMDDSLLPFNPQGFYLMRNLLAPKELGHLHVDPSQVEELNPFGKGHLSWYGKVQLAPGRKMGHVSLRAEDAVSLEKARTHLEERESGFWARLKQ